MSTHIKKTFHIALDIKKAASVRDIMLVEGDTGNVLEIAVTDDGAPVQLAGCLVTAVFSKSNGTALQDSMSENGGITLGGTDGNVASVSLFTSSFAPGVVECELCIYSGDNNETLITSAKFNFRVRRGIMNQDTVQATEQYPLLTELIERVMQAEAHAASLLPPHSHGALTFAGRLPVDAATLAANDASSASCGRMAVAGANGALGAVNAARARALMGAMKRPITETVIVPVTAWQLESGYTGDFPYYATVAASGIAASMLPEVIFEEADAASGLLSPACTSVSGGVRIRAAKVYPDAISVTVRASEA